MSYFRLFSILFYFYGANVYVTMHVVPRTQLLCVYVQEITYALNDLANYERM